MNGNKGVGMVNAIVLGKTGTIYKPRSYRELFYSLQVGMAYPLEEQAREWERPASSVRHQASYHRALTCVKRGDEVVVCVCNPKTLRKA